MICIKLYSIFLITQCIIIFNLVENGQTLTYMQKYQIIQEERAIRSSCADYLSSLGYLGYTANDLLLNKSMLTRNHGEKTVTVYSYIRTVELVISLYTSIDSDLIDLYCTKIDPLVRLNFTGDYEHDTNNFPSAEGLLEDIKDAYRTFITSPYFKELYHYLATNTFKPVNLLGLYTEKIRWLKVPVDIKQCTNHIISLGYDGSWATHCNILNLKPNPANETEVEYRNFIKYLTKNGLYMSAKNFIIFFCEVVAPLKADKFTGSIVHDIEHKPTNKALTDLVRNYKLLLKVSIYNENWKDCDFTYEYAMLKVFSFHV